MNEETAKKALMKVEDPELMLDIVSLGLIYRIEVKDKEVKVLMTLTSPSCPYAPMMLNQAKKELEVVGFKKVDIHLTFSPPWEPNEEVKMMLGLS